MRPRFFAILKLPVISLSKKNCLASNIERDPLNATNASKYLIDQLEERILIDQSKNASKHS